LIHIAFFLGGAAAEIVLCMTLLMFVVVTENKPDK